MLIYTRVSTEMQVEGFSLEGQLNELISWCAFEKMEVVGIYEEKEKSGKSIEGRPKFQEMLSDIQEERVMAICYSKEDIADYKCNVVNIDERNEKYMTYYYYIKESIFIKADEIIPLS